MVWVEEPRIDCDEGDRWRRSQWFPCSSLAIVVGAEGGPGGLAGALGLIGAGGGGGGGGPNQEVPYIPASTGGGGGSSYADPTATTGAAFVSGVRGGAGSVELSFVGGSGTCAGPEIHFTG